MPAVARVPLGGETLNRKYYLDVNTGTHTVPTWAGVFGISDFQPSANPTLQDDSDFDSGGGKSQVVTATSFALAFKVERKVVSGAPTTYNPGQEFLRDAALGMGLDNVVEVRWYEMNLNDAGVSVGPKVEAFMGYAVVSWNPDGGGMDAKSTVSVTLSGRGLAVPITHPDGAQLAPVVYSITPNTGTTAGGVLVHIHGSHFMLAGVADVDAAADVMLAAHNFTSYTVEDDNNIWGITPAETAISSAITVTNSIGASNTNVSYTSA